MKKRSRGHATFCLRGAISRGIVFAAAILCGCGLLPGQAADRAEDAQLLVDQGTQALREGRLQEAHAAFSLAYDLAPQAAALDGQGCVALLEGEAREAEALFRRAHESDPDYGEALAHLALAYDAQGMRDEAMALYDEAIEASPGLAAVRNDRAALAFDLGRERRWVAAELRKAELLLPRGVATDNLARVLRDEGRKHGKEGNAGKAGAARTAGAAPPAGLPGHRWRGGGNPGPAGR